MISRLKHDATHSTPTLRGHACDHESSDDASSSQNGCSWLLGGLLFGREGMKEWNRYGAMLDCVESLLAAGYEQGGTHNRIDQRGSRARIKDCWHFTSEKKRLGAKKLKSCPKLVRRVRQSDSEWEWERGRNRDHS